MENNNFLSEQIITYIGNKRKLLNYIENKIRDILKDLGVEKAKLCDLFSGSGIVARLMKQYATVLYVNDLEPYSCAINDCYLTNVDEFDQSFYSKMYDMIMNSEKVEGIITKNYAPKDTNNIQMGERVFYTHENAVIIDTIRSATDNVPKPYRKFFIAPLLYEASVHTNTSGVFKGFYKSKTSKIGKFGGDGEFALNRIMGEIHLKQPVFSSNSCPYTIFNEDANSLVEYLYNVDITYIDPPYNQHPYGSNYFMLNVILNNTINSTISNVSGIPSEWNKSNYNKKDSALVSFEQLIKNIDSKYLIISYNNEGIIPIGQLESILNTYGDVKKEEIKYNTFKGSRNLMNREIYTTEYIFVVKKYNKYIKPKAHTRILF